METNDQGHGQKSVALGGETTHGSVRGTAG
jgi:hypothetical protein